MRAYEQNCGVARSLDLVGERWTLLIVRELLLGPKRFKDLLVNLPGSSTNLLADRLKALESDDICRKVVLPRPSGIQAYALTERGSELREVIFSLARWGFPLTDHGHNDAATRTSWAALGVLASPRSTDLINLDLVAQFRVDNDAFWVRVQDSDVSIQDGEATSATFTIRTDLTSFLSIIEHKLEPATAFETSRIQCEGNMVTAQQFMNLFRLPFRRHVSH